MGTFFTTANHDFDPDLNNIISINSAFDEDEHDIEDNEQDCDPHVSGNF
ncbi:MAG: hypothetical protein V4548_00410 [Bacteroidota bacterium]